MSLVVEYSGKLYTCLSLDDIIAEHKQWPKFNRDMSIFDYCLETIFLSFHLKFAAVVGFFHSLSLVTMLLLCVCMFFIRRRCCFFLQAFVVFTISLIEWLLCVHWIIWFRVVGCLAFRMQPRLYFHLLHWEHRKNCQTIHYTFFPFDIRSLCSPCSMLTHSYCCYSSVFMDAVSWVHAKYIHLHTKVYGFVTAYEERMCYWSCPLNRKFNGNEVFVCWAHTINSARTLRIQNIQANRKRKKIGRYGASNGERAFLRLFFPCVGWDCIIRVAITFDHPHTLCQLSSVNIRPFNACGCCHFVQWMIQPISRKYPHIHTSHTRSHTRSHVVHTDSLTSFLHSARDTSFWVAGESFFIINIFTESHPQNFSGVQFSSIRAWVTSRRMSLFWNRLIEILEKYYSVWRHFNASHQFLLSNKFIVELKRHNLCAIDNQNQTSINLRIYRCFYSKF